MVGGERLRSQQPRLLAVIDQEDDRVSLRFLGLEDPCDLEHGGDAHGVVGGAGACGNRVVVRRIAAAETSAESPTVRRRPREPPRPPSCFILKRRRCRASRAYREVRRRSWFCRPSGRAMLPAAPPRRGRAKVRREESNTFL